jgi:3'-phosphoadenosine 5'-phosphosulfate sulfotransferase (PAPS reductase)/FAD synthetase
MSSGLKLEERDSYTTRFLNTPGMILTSEDLEAAKSKKSYFALSLGAGVNSTALLVMIVRDKMPLDEVIFADTGAEKPETYAYLEKWILPFLVDEKIPYARVRAKETLIERCYRGHTIPDRNYRWSTRDYKVRPINKHLKPHAPVVVYLGIAADEAERVAPPREKWVSKAYPLIYGGLKRQALRRSHCVAGLGYPT